MPIVSNRFPTRFSNQRLAIIGEAPSKDDECSGRPFSDSAGRFLAALLSRAGLSMDACFLGNVSQHRPPSFDLSSFSWTGLEIQHGLEKLREDLARFNPNCVLLLGNVPLKAARDIYSTTGWPKRFRYPNAKWRGSLFLAEEDASPFKGRKCITSYAPWMCLRDYDLTPFLQFDLRKAVREAAFPSLTLPQRTIEVPTDADYVISKLRLWRQQRKKTACDIEGWVYRMSCIGFADSPNYAMVIPFHRKDMTSWWQPQDEKRIWREVTALLEEPFCEKIFMNGNYDRFCLHYGHGIRVLGATHDIMLSHWEFYSELAKDDRKQKGRKGLGLDIQASIYTDEPYYKFEGKEDDDMTFFLYNGKDCCVTYEIHEKHLAYWANTTPGTGYTPQEFQSQQRHYALNIQLLNPLLYMENRGILYNSAEAERRRLLLRRKLYEAQAKLNRLTGFGFKWQTKGEIFDRARQLMAFKKAAPTTFYEIAANAKKDYIPIALELAQVMEQPDPDYATIGQIENLCEVSLNVDSSKQMIAYLYGKLGLPTQWSEKRGETPHPTTDYEALIKLSRVLARDEWRVPDSGGSRKPTGAEKAAAVDIIQTAIELRALDTRATMLEMCADPDGRTRCGYNIVGSNTGRLSCHESPTGSGGNLQTIPNHTDPALAPGGVLGDRDLYLADPDYWFFQCDLAGADGWTVAAYANMFGDSTMLDDYRSGIRPFERLALKLLGIEIPKDRAELKAACKKHIDKNGWPRFACKRVQHGGCYLEGAVTVHRNIFKDSEGKLYLPVNECQDLLNYWFQLYWGIKKWHEWCARTIAQRPVLQAASGQVRHFFGRPDDILTKAVAFEPQANTTYATNLAMHRLWTDPENRQPAANGKLGLRVEPLHQVHDALCGQFRKADTEWAARKIKSWFANPLLIAGQQITIPYEGGYGPSWGELDDKTRKL